MYYGIIRITFCFSSAYFRCYPFLRCSVSKKDTDPVETFAKNILKGARGEKYLDQLLRECVREFPHREGLLFQQVISKRFSGILNRWILEFLANDWKYIPSSYELLRFSCSQMVRSLTRKKDPCPALDVIVGAINSQSGFGDEYSPCSTCSEPKAIKKCSKCKAVQYCDLECQRLHWFMHKKECARPSTGGNGNVAKDENDEALIDHDNLSEVVRNLIMWSTGLLHLQAVAFYDTIRFYKSMSNEAPMFHLCVSFAVDSNLEKHKYTYLMAFWQLNVSPDQFFSISSATNHFMVKLRVSTWPFFRILYSLYPMHSTLRRHFVSSVNII